MKKAFHNIKGNKAIFMAIMISVAVGIVIILSGMAYYNYRMSALGIEKPKEYQRYQYHYVIISGESDEPFWDDVYEGALERGKEEDTYIEKIGSNLTIDYSPADLMEIAIASKVDGIIIEPNGDDTINTLINKADEAGIPVITVLKDAPNSKRKSFIGINSYNQGQAYSKQVLEVLEEGKRNVTVLYDSKNNDSGQDIIYSNIAEAVRYRNVEVKSATVNAESTFSSEEDIRNLIMDQQNPTDVLVCLTAVDTLSAYRAVVDYNKVGQVDIIGYYDSDLILRAIEKRIIHSTMTINANMMGKLCVDALAEYKNTNRVSDYFSIDISVINRNNISYFINSRNNADESNES